MPIKYDKYGLRRDKNLSDVEDRSLTLTNILNDLALPGQTFIDKDLLVINNLAQTNVDPEDFRLLAGQAIKSTQLKKTYTIRVEFPLQNVSVDPGYEFIINDNDCVLIDVGSVDAPDDTGNENEFFETILTIQAPPVDLGVQPGDTISIANVPYTILTVLGAADTQNIFTIKPQITLNDQLQYYYLATGKDQKANSGNGLEAYFFPSTEVSPDQFGAFNISGVLQHPANNYDPLLYGPFDFWEDGQFDLDRRIFDSVRFNDTAGGILFTGMINLNPAQAKTDTIFSMRTNGYTIVEAQRKIGENEYENRVVARTTPQQLPHLPFGEMPNINGQFVFAADSSEAEIIAGQVYLVVDMYFSVIENEVESQPSDNRVNVSILEQKAFAIGPGGETLSGNSVQFRPASDDYDPINIISRNAYLLQKEKYYQEYLETNGVLPEYLEGTFYISDQLNEDIDQQSEFWNFVNQNPEGRLDDLKLGSEATFGPFNSIVSSPAMHPIVNAESLQYTTAVKIERNEHFFEQVPIQILVWWPQQFQTWEKKVFKFTGEETDAFGTNVDFTRVNKKYENEDGSIDDRSPTNIESIPYTFENASRLGSNVVKNDLSIDNTLRVNSPPPITYRHVQTNLDYNQYSLLNPRPDYEFTSTIPVEFGHPGWYTYSPLRGPLSFDKTVENLTARPGDFLVNIWDRRFFNRPGFYSEVLGNSTVSQTATVNTIDSISPAELIHLSNPHTLYDESYSSFREAVLDYFAFTSSGSIIPLETSNGGSDFGVRVISDADILQDPQNYDVVQSVPTAFDFDSAVDNRPLVITHKCLTSNYSNLLDDQVDWGAIISENDLKLHNQTIKNYYADNGGKALRFLLGNDVAGANNVKTDYLINYIEGESLTIAGLFTAAARGSYQDPFTQLLVPGSNLITFATTLRTLEKDGLTKPTPGTNYESVVLDSESALNIKFVKRGNFVVGFKGFSDLLYSPYFTTKRVVGENVEVVNPETGAVEGYRIYSPNHGLEDRQIVVYHTAGSDPTNLEIVDKWAVFIPDGQGSRTYALLDEEPLESVDKIRIRFIQDTSGYGSNYDRKAVVDLIDDNNFTLKTIQTLPTDESTNPYYGYEAFLPNDKDELEAQYRYFRDDYPNESLTEAMIVNVSFDPFQKIVVDLVEYDENAIPESVLGVAYAKKYQYESGITEIEPYYPPEFVYDAAVPLAEGEEPAYYDIYSCEGTLADLSVPDVPLFVDGQVVLETIQIEDPVLVPQQNATGWIVKTNSQSLNPNWLLDRLNNPALEEDVLDWTPTKIHLNGVQRMDLYENADPAVGLNGDPANPALIDLPMSGSFEVVSVSVYEDDRTVPAIGPISESQAYFGNDFLTLEQGEVLITETRPVLMPGDPRYTSNPTNASVNNFIPTLNNAKMRVEYESFLGTKIDKHDMGDQDEKIFSKWISLILDVFNETPTNTQFKNMEYRVNRYLNTEFSKSMRGGVQAPLWAPSTKPVAIETAEIQPDGSMFLRFDNFNQIPSNDLFYLHNGWEDSGVLIDPYASEYIAVYSDKSVVDYSKLEFCKDVIPLRVPNGANAGANQVTVYSEDNPTEDYFVQFSGYVSPGTKIDSVISGSPFSIINLTAPLLKSLEPGYILTTAPDNLADYEICTISLNTAPPFEGTESGLATTSVAPELEVNELVFENLSMKSAPATVITNETTATSTLTINYVDDLLQKTPFKLIAK